MDKLTKIKCFGCGVFIVAVVGVESLPVFCHECHHISMPHLPERNYSIEFSRPSTASVSGIMDTATASIVPWPDSFTKN